MENQLSKLASMLEDANIPFEWGSIFSKHDQILYPNARDRLSDVICFEGSYGYREGLLEQMGLIPEAELKLINDTVQGHLTANIVFERWKEHYDNNK